MNTLHCHIVKWIVAALSGLIGSLTLAAEPTVTLSHLRGNVYFAEDTFYIKENSAVYIGADHVTVVGATWTPETAKLLASEIAKITKRPITEVIDTNYHPDRAGGNAYFKGIGAKVISTEMTCEFMKTGWDGVISATHQAMPSYPVLRVVLPNTVYPGDFALQDGHVKAIYLGP